MRKPTRSAKAEQRVVRELRLWQFTRSLEAVFEELGDGKKYYNRSKNLAEARNLLDRWLLSFQMDYKDKMDASFPVFPQRMSSKDPVNAKLIDECMEKHFSLDEHNATKIFETLHKEIEEFKAKYGGDSYNESRTIEYFEDDDKDNAEIVVRDADGDFKTQHCQRVRFLVGNFGLQASTRMLMRYETLGTGSLQWGDPITVHNALYREMGVRYEGFASPLNSKMLGKKGAHFCSLFFDTDEEFGSLGNFFEVDFGLRPGGWTVNPPFIESLMEKVADKILAYVRSDPKSVDNVFFVTFPRWTDTPGWEKLDKADVLLDKIDLFSGDFTVQCCYGRVFPPRNDLTIFIVGRQLPDGASVDKIKRIFRDTDTDYIKEEWQKNCQIKMNRKEEKEPVERRPRRERPAEQSPEPLVQREPVAEYTPQRILKRWQPKQSSDQQQQQQEEEEEEPRRKKAKAAAAADSMQQQQQQQEEEEEVEEPPRKKAKAAAAAAAAAAAGSRQQQQEEEEPRRKKANAAEESSQ